jgi:hypothetical protein
MADLEVAAEQAQEQVAWLGAEEEAELMYLMIARFQAIY